MTDSIDSAAWTGRTWESRWLFYVGRAGFELIYFWRERDLEQGRRGHVYGIKIGRDLCRDLCGVFFFWNYWQRGLVWI